MALLGERFKHERESRGLSIFQVEIDTRIRAAVLQMLEDGDYGHLPPEPFLRGLVRWYANYLRISPDDALNLLAVDLIAPPTTATPPPPKVALAKNYSPPSISAPQPPGPEAGTLGTSVPPPASDVPPTAPGAVADLMASFRHLNVPMPVTIAVAVVVAFACVICGAVAMTQFSPGIFSAAARATQTNTRVPFTITPTVATGAAATNIPVIPVTAAPFPTFPGNPTATPRPLPRRTIEVQTGLNLDIEANGSIKVIVGIDNIPIYSGIMDPGTTRTWSAKESLYFRVEKASDANIYFNGKEVLAATYSERLVMERRWELPKGSTNPNRTAPFTPIAPTATRTLTSTPIYTITPTTFDTATPTP